MEVVAIVLIGLVFLFGWVLMFGAPYLPTLKRQTTIAFDLLELKRGMTLLELGCGDGRVLRAAAERGLFAVGYELNPLLAAYAWMRTRKYRGQVRVVWGNFWKKSWPEADGIFVFLLARYMKRLDTKIVQECRKPVNLVSFAFEISGKKPLRSVEGVHLYAYKA